MTHWSRLGNVGINAVQSKLSTHRKIGCSLLANMSLSTGKQEGIVTLICYVRLFEFNSAMDTILNGLSPTAQKLVSSHIRRAREQFSS